MKIILKLNEFYYFLGCLLFWYVSCVFVYDFNNDKKFLFICESWFVVEEGDGIVDRLILVVGYDEMISFNYFFYFII